MEPAGTYTLNGNQLAIRYQNGQTENYTYKPLQGGMQLIYMIYTPVKKFSAGTKLNGTWSRLRHHGRSPHPLPE